MRRAEEAVPGSRRTFPVMTSSFLNAVRVRAVEMLIHRPEEGAVAYFWRQHRVQDRGAIVGHTHFRVCFSDEIMAGDLMRSTRVALILRGQYCEATLSESSICGVNHVEFEATLPSPAILNEVRVRAVADGGSRSVSAFTVWGAAPRDTASRLDSPWVKSEVVDFDGASSMVYGPPWWLLVDHPEYRGDNLEVRCFALCHVPRVAPCSAPVRAALLSMPDFAAAWSVALSSGLTPLTASLARLLLEERSKLRSFLDMPAKESAVEVEVESARADGGPLPADAWFRRAGVISAARSDADDTRSDGTRTTLSGAPRLKAWPSKGGVQQTVALWMCASLIPGHEYTEPELYAHISDLCAYQPDHGVVRKEMVRHGYLEQPVICQNADCTTSTTYRLAHRGVEAALRSDVIGALTLKMIVSK